MFSENLVDWSQGIGVISLIVLYICVFNLGYTRITGKYLYGSYHNSRLAWLTAPFWCTGVIAVILACGAVILVGIPYTIGRVI